MPSSLTVVFIFLFYLRVRIYLLLSYKFFNLLWPDQSTVQCAEAAAAAITKWLTVPTLATQNGLLTASSTVQYSAGECCA